MPSRPRKSKYKQIYSGEWEPWTRDVDLACCDCSLVHNIRSRIRGGEFQMQFTANKRATAALRRHHKIKVIKGK